MKNVLRLTILLLSVIPLAMHGQEKDLQQQQTENLRALGLERFGAPANVDSEKPPYHHTRILTTDYPGGKLESVAAHETFLNPKNADVFKIVWDYVLTEPVQ